MSWLPAELLAPETLPKEARLPLRYFLPYYGLGKLGWTLYNRRPVDPELRWDPDSRWNDAFKSTGASEWGDPTDDAAFTALRLQGPNPFLLKRAAPDENRGDSADELVFDLDFSALFDGVFEPVVARFAVRSGQLVPAWISIGDEIIHPGEPGWADAKRVVNGLDARYVVFIRHLLNVHLMVGQAYAVAAFALPTWHPLRPFMDFFTYGTLQVNDLAYKSLLVPSSYFLLSNFVSPVDARILIENAMREFDFDEWIVDIDMAKRGVDSIPDHPYVEDARVIWPAIESVVERHLDDLDIFEDDVRADRHIQSWYFTLAEILPDDRLPRCESRDDLEKLLAALIYNNVIHEVAGNFSPIVESDDSADRLMVNIDHLRDLAAGTTAEPRAADVFLMDQASYVSRFNVAGNNLLRINAARFIDDPRLRVAIEDLQSELADLDDFLAGRNESRRIPFRAMQPRIWEASVSF